MEWKLSEEQQAYQETLRGWLADFAGPDRVRSWLDDGDLSTFAERFAADGWLGVGTAEELGGQGGGVVELALTAEELGRSAAPSSVWLATVLTVPALGALPDGPTAWLFPAEEPPGVASGVAIDAEGCLSGRVPRVLGGAEATGFVVAVGAAGERQLRFVAADADGVQRTPRRLLDRSRTVADVALDKVASTAVDGDADEVLARAVDVAAVLVAADSLGAAERMLQLAVDYSVQRRQFGVPVGSFQAVKHAAATIEVGVEAGRSAVYFAAASVEADLPDCSLHAAAVKAQVTEEGGRTADTALTMHGAIGFTWEHDLQLFYKRARLDQHLLGDAITWNERIADGLALV